MSSYTYMLSNKYEDSTANRVHNMDIYIELWKQLFT